MRRELTLAKAEPKKNKTADFFRVSLKAKVRVGEGHVQSQPISLQIFSIFRPYLTFFFVVAVEYFCVQYYFLIWSGFSHGWSNTGVYDTDTDMGGVYDTAPSRNP